MDTVSPSPQTPMQQPIPSVQSSLTPKKPFPFLWVGIGIFVLLFICTGAYYFLGNHQQRNTYQVPLTQNNTQVSPDQIADSSSAKQTTTLDVTKLPLGDGKYTTPPKVGYIYTCQQQFNGGGAQTNGSWIHGNTWNLNEKIAVQGRVTWPNAQFTVSTNGNNRIITGNGLPVDTDTGTFPIASTDPAYQIDRNPNTISAQTVNITLPLNPVMGSTPTCIHGMVGVALNGVAIFDGLDAAGRDAVAHEVQDVCDGHPEKTGEYHYHGPSSCLPNEKKNNALIGYAFDGYGIYSMYDATGKEYTNADLDACHGITSVVMWNGKMQNVYHYVLTQEYPYTVGCFKGSVVKEPTPSNVQNGTNAHQGGNGQFSPSGFPPQGPPPSGVPPRMPPNTQY